jgi:uncharacterized membrane protein
MDDSKTCHMIFSFLIYIYMYVFSNQKKTGSYFMNVSGVCDQCEQKRNQQREKISWEIKWIIIILIVTIV